jgi:hypothetical protein
MTLFSKVLSNGFVLIIPILAWNILFASRLPPAFHPKSFNRDVPSLIVLGENMFRTIVFLMPLLFRINLSSSTGKAGSFIYLTGTLLYFLSWLMLIHFPYSTWSTNLPGFAAPAYTPLIWLVGLSLMADSYYFSVPFSSWHYFVPSAAFCMFHLLHTLHVYKRI